MEEFLLRNVLQQSPYGWVMLFILAMAVCVSVITKSVYSTIRTIANLKNMVSLNSKDYKKQLKDEADVTAVLKAVREEFSADRVILLQYHNGVRSVANNHLLKVSATHEVVSKTSRSMLTNIQQWPCSFLEDWNNHIFENEYVLVEADSFNKDEQDLKGMYEFMAGYGVSRAVLFPVSDSYGNVFGVGMVHLPQRQLPPDTKQVRWGYNRFQAIGALLAGVPKE